MTSTSGGTISDASSGCHREGRGKGCLGPAILVGGGEKVLDPQVLDLPVALDPHEVGAVGAGAPLAPCQMCARTSGKPQLPAVTHG